MTEKGYSETTYKILRGLRRTATDEAEFNLAIPKPEESELTCLDQTVASKLRQFENPAYKILRGLRKLDDDLTTAYNALSAESPVPRQPRVRVIPTYGQPVLVQDASGSSYWQYKIISHELVRPGQAAEEDIPDDVDEFVEEEPQILPVDDAALRHYKKFDSYDMVNTESDTEAGDVVSAANEAYEQQASNIDMCSVVADEDEGMDGLFGIYAREH